MKQFNLEEYLKNPEKKLVTKGGLNARIICTDRKDLNYPIVALIEDKFAEGECVLYYTKEGKIFADDLNDLDLFFVPEKKEGWINISKGIFNNNIRLLGHTRIFKTKENAEEAGEGVSGYIKTIKIEWEEE